MHRHDSTCLCSTGRNGTPRRRFRRSFGTALIVGAVSIGSISAWQVNASSQNESSFVPTTPCRLFDTRPGNDPEDGKKTPLGSGESNVYTQQVTGTIGDCDIPGDATAVAMNVTAVNPTAQSNLRIYPADVPTPTVSNLNWVAGQAPTPNKVDVQLSPNGAITLYNHKGTVDVVADVVGYYTPNALDQMRQRLNEVESNADEHESRLAALEAGADESGRRIADVERSAPFTLSVEESDVTTFGGDPKTVLEMNVTAPVDGDLTVDFSATIVNWIEYTLAKCSVFDTAELPIEQDWTTEPGVAVETAGVIANVSGPVTLTAAKRFELEADEVVTIALVCEHPGGNEVYAFGRSMTGLFTPA